MRKTGDVAFIIDHEKFEIFQCVVGMINKRKKNSISIFIYKDNTFFLLWVKDKDLVDSEEKAKSEVLKLISQKISICKDKIKELKKITKNSKRIRIAYLKNDDI